MKAHNVPLALLAVFFIGAIAQAQSRTSSPETRQDLQIDVQQKLQEYQSQLAGVQQGLRGGGGRGTLTVPPLPVKTMNWMGVAWWTNTAMVERLGLTDDQKAKIERAFENHRQQIMSSTGVLEKEEAQLAKLLEAESIDRNAVLSQIDRVSQARGEVERANSAMTLEMRESLTRAQWLQLQPPQRVRVGANVLAANLISQVEPVYPESARQAGIQGPVVLEVEINREGTVESVRVNTGQPQLVQAASDAVKQWRYKPTRLNGETVAVVSTITVNFPFSAGGRGAAPPPSPAGPGQRRGRGPQ